MATADSGSCPPFAAGTLSVSKTAKFPRAARSRTTRIGICREPSIKFARRESTSPIVEIRIVLAMAAVETPSVAAFSVSTVMRNSGRIATLSLEAPTKLLSDAISRRIRSVAA
ncbi:hypothetical protein D3C87_1646670 [compost metagenome]